MQSKISFFNKTLYKKNLTRFWPFALLYWLYLTVLHPLGIYMTLEARGDLNESASTIVADHFSYLECFSVFVIALVMAVAVFSYLYQSRSANMVHAFPVTRRELFVSNYLAGLTLLVIPLAVTALVTNLVVLGKANDMVWLIWAYFGISAAVMLFFYSFACLMCMFTGQILAAGLFYMIWNFLYVVALFLVTGLISLFEYGVSSDGILDSYIKPLFPLGWFMSRLDFYYDATGRYRMGGSGALLYAILGGLVFTVLAYFIYQKRQLERAGDFLSMSWTKPVFRWGTAIVGSIAGALCLTFMTGEDRSVNGMVTKFVIFLVICGLILFFVAEMFVEKSFKVFKKPIAMEAVSCIAVLLVGCALLQFDIFGIESYVPQTEEIRDAAVDCVGNFVFTDEDELEAVTDVHRYIVDQIPMLKGTYGASYENYQYMTIRYTLKSGKSVSRSYYIQCDDKEFLDGLNQKLAAIEYSAEAAKRSYFGTDYEALDWQVLGATIEYMKTDTYEEYTVYGSEEQMQELYTAVLADIDAGAIWGKNTGSGETTVESAESADESEDTSFISAVLRLSLGTDALSNEVEEQIENSYHTTDITGSSSQGTNVDVSLSIDENFTHTIETLVKLGTIESEEDLRVE